MYIDRLTEQLIRHEGLRLKPYRCPAGALTIGVGRNLESKGISESEALSMLKIDIVDARADVGFILDHFDLRSWMLNPARYDALVNMAFNMGRQKLMGFKKLFSSIKNEDFENAAAEILDSKYAQDVGGRAIELAEQMRAGAYRK